MSTGPRLACTILIAALLGTLAPRPALGDEPAARGLTALESGPYARAGTVLAGSVEQVTDVRAPGGAVGRQVVRVRVTRVFKGDVTPGEVVTVLVLGQRPTLDPQRPSVPYFRAGSRDRFILFLGREEGGVAHRLQTLFDGEGQVGAEKEAAVAAVAGIAALEDEGERGRRTLAWLLEGLASRGRWTRAHAARELGFLAARRPGLFDARVRARLRRLPAATLSPDERFWLRRVFALLEAAAPDAGVPPASAPVEADPFRERFRAAVEPEERQALLAGLVPAGATEVDERAWWAWRQLEPSLREWFVRMVGDRAVRGALAGVRRAYANEQESAVREAIVRTVGLLGGPADVPWLAGRLGNVTLRRAALLALARVRTAEALTYLEAARTAARGAGEHDRSAWIEYLLGADFVQAERRAGRSVGPR